MPNGAGAPPSTRPGRCANHPATASVAACELCGRALCIGCAVPVRGRVIGPECLGSVLENAPPPSPPPLAVERRGDWLAIAGFGLVTVLSIFPWSRFGDSSHLFGAWSLHWSLVATVAAVVGLGFGLFVRRRPTDALTEACVYGGLGLIVAGAALLHHHHPPPLAAGSDVPWLAVAGGALALVGAGWKATSRVKGLR